MSRKWYGIESLAARTQVQVMSVLFAAGLFIVAVEADLTDQGAADLLG